MGWLLELLGRSNEATNETNSRPPQYSNAKYQYHCISSASSLNCWVVINSMTQRSTGVGGLLRANYIAPTAVGRWESGRTAVSTNSAAPWDSTDSNVTIPTTRPHIRCHCSPTVTLLAPPTLEIAFPHSPSRIHNLPHHQPVPHRVSLTLTVPPFYLHLCDRPSL